MISLPIITLVPSRQLVVEVVREGTEDERFCSTLQVAADRGEGRLLTREKQATTGIGKGVALPHAKVSGIKKAVGTIGRSSEGIDFSALDYKPVYSVILLLSSPDDPDGHLQAMETIFKHVQRDIFRKFLRQSETAEAIAELVEEAEELA